MPTTCFYKPVVSKRLFTADKYYADIDWGKFSEVLAAFKDRIEGWYIKPCDELTGHYSFASMALMCLLIDMLSQYRNGPIKDSKTGKLLYPIESDGASFKGFVRDFFPIFRQKLSPPIEYRRKNNPKYVNDLADAFYAAFRCGILHSAYVPLFGVIGGQTAITDIKLDVTEYEGTGSPCPTVAIDPDQLRNLIMAYWTQYIADLSNPSTDAYYVDLRDKFRMKFEDSFGIKISMTI